MILSIGIDIVEVYRIEQAVARTPRFAERVFTEHERLYSAERGAGQNASLAARFAAKEAFFKALRTGWRGQLSWTDVEVRSDDKGAPRLKVIGEAQIAVERMGGGRIHLSISHTKTHAVAFVIIEAA